MSTYVIATAPTGSTGEVVTRFTDFLKDFDFLETIGKGHFSTVFSAFHKKRNCKVAVRIEQLKDPSEVERFNRMVSTLKKHSYTPFILKCLDSDIFHSISVEIASSTETGVQSSTSVVGPNSLMTKIKPSALSTGILVTPFHSMTIDKWITESRNIERSVFDGLSAVVPIILPIAVGLDSLHRSGHVHRDIHVKNVHAEADSHDPLAVYFSIIGDFGLSFDVKKYTALTIHRLIIPPECKDGKHFDRPGDVYQFGILVACCILKKNLSGIDPDSAIFVQSNDEFDIPKDFQRMKDDMETVLKNSHPEILDLFNRSVDAKPDSRPTMADWVQLLVMVFARSSAKATKDVLRMSTEIEDLKKRFHNFQELIDSYSRFNEEKSKELDKTRQVLGQSRQELERSRQELGDTRKELRDTRHERDTLNRRIERSVVLFAVTVSAIAVSLLSVSIMHWYTGAISTPPSVSAMSTVTATWTVAEIIADMKRANLGDLCELMKDNLDNPNVIIEGLKIIITATDLSNENRIMIASSGGIPIIVNAMKEHGDHAGVQEYACRALRFLCRNDDNKVTVASSGGIPVILDAMTKHSENADIQEYACWALINLAANNSENQVKIASSGGITVILDAMKKHANHAGVQEQACWALRNLAYNNADNKINIASSGGIPVILDAMKKHANHADIQQYGCWALSNLAVNSDNKINIASIGAIPIILDAMINHENNVGVQEQACFALSNLSSNNDNMNIIKSSGALDLIKLAMTKYPNSYFIQTYGKKTLQNCA